MNQSQQWAVDPVLSRNALLLLQADLVRVTMTFTVKGN